MSSPQAHVAQWKKDVVQQVAQLAKNYPIVGVLNMESLPAAQLAQMKKKLRGTVEMVMARRSLLLRALDQSPGLAGLRVYIEKGMPALLFTKENPFALFKTLKKSKSKAAAKPGQIAPYDLVIPAGPTPFAPGPVISEFAQIGVKAGVEGGKVAVKMDCVVAKAGEPIKPGVASMIARLGIEPMEIGLNLTAVFEKGTVYPASVLDIDEEAFAMKLAEAVTSALNLGVEVCYPTPEVLDIVIARAWRACRAVVRESHFLASGMTDEVLGDAERVALSMKEEFKL